MAPHSCPKIDALERFLLGKSRGSERNAVADHLLVCPSCADVVETISAIDELTLALGDHRLPTTMDAQSPQLAKAIEIAQDLKQP